MKKLTIISEFLDSAIQSPFSGVEIVRHNQGKPYEILRLDRSSQEMYPLSSIDIDTEFDPSDPDTKAMLDILAMPHVFGIGFEDPKTPYCGSFVVYALVYATDYRLDNTYIRRKEYEQSHYDRIAPLHGLRRRLGIDSISPKEWQKMMRNSGKDVRFVRNSNDTYSVIVSTGERTRTTTGRTPYEALAPWSVFVSSSAGRAFRREKR